jgi:hypothetical protein
MLYTESVDARGEEVRAREGKRRQKVTSTELRKPTEKGTQSG